MLNFLIIIIFLLPFIVALFGIIGLTIDFWSDDKKKDVPDKIEIIIKMENTDEKKIERKDEKQ